MSVEVILASITDPALIGSDHSSVSVHLNG